MGVEDLPPFVFVIWPGGIRRLGMLEVGSLGILSFSPPLGIYQRVRFVFGRSYFMGSRVPKGVVCLGNLALLYLCMLAFMSQVGSPNCLGRLSLTIGIHFVFRV